MHFFPSVAFNLLAPFLKKYWPPKKVFTLALKLNFVDETLQYTECRYFFWQGEGGVCNSQISKNLSVLHLFVKIHEIQIQKPCKRETVLFPIY